MSVGGRSDVGDVKTLYGVKKLSEKKKNFNTTLEPGVIQVYNYLAQLTLTHQKFESARDRKIKSKGAHLVSGPQERISGRSQAASVHCNMSITQEKGLDNICVQKQKSQPQMDV